PAPIGRGIDLDGAVSRGIRREVRVVEGAVPVDANRRIPKGVRRAGRPWQKTVRPGLSVVVRRGKPRDLNAIGDETGPGRVGDDVNAHRVVVADDDVLAEGGRRDLALGGADERTETREDLHVIARREICLDIVTAELNLRNCV